MTNKTTITIIGAMAVLHVQASDLGHLKQTDVPTPPKAAVTINSTASANSSSMMMSTITGTEFRTDRLFSVTSQSSANT